MHYTSLAFFSLKTALYNSDSVAYIVNISGKQRMLSQHIALDVHKVFYMLESKKENEQVQYYNYISLKLSSNVKEMLKANKILSTGQLGYKDIELSKEIYDIYFGDSDLSKRVETYATTALSILESKNIDDAKVVLDFISLNSEPLLKDLNRAVLQYQKEGEDSLELIEKLETAVYIITIFVLLLEVIFIFQPMVRHIVDLTKDKNDLLDNLQQKVEIRTLHLKRLNEKLNNLAYHDPLTGLRNRLSLEKDVEDLILHHEQHKADFAVLLLDIDFFKDVNDTYGHDIGDIVLKELAELFRKSFRENDKIYRAGGEEFVVLLNRISLENALEVAQHCRVNVMNHTFDIEDDIKFSKTISGGLYHSSMNCVHKFKSVMKFADIALYEAKNSGRNKIELYKDFDIN
ncbi:MAG: GGDEF domain-containing protein [Campylobacterales bacterium]|nr:GGDEF domain-containing protein [Campylobacterales bacterium]